jgi:hypothetical protein
MKRHRVGPQLVLPNPHQLQGVCIQDVEAIASVHQNLENRELLMTGSTTRGNWPRLGMRFG